MPSKAMQAQMKYDLYEQRTITREPLPDSNFPASISRKRILKASFKGIKYQACSFLNESRAKTQSSDYYVGVYDEKKDKCYLLPVGAAYQMGQRIAGFSENFGATQEVDPSVKALTYYDQKQLLAQSFGTAKA